MVEIGFVVEDPAEVDDTVEHVAEQFGDVDPGRGRAAPPAGVAEERLGGRQLAVRDADDADGGAGPGNRERRRDGLGGADALQCRVSADAAGEIEHSLDGFLSARLDDVGGAKLTGHLLPVSVTTECDDALRAEPPGGQDGAQADGTVPNDRYRVTLLHPGHDRRVVPGGHHIGQREQRPQYRIRMS